jgi:phosphoribosylformylglycinamidine cyclo-ligase
MSEVPLHHHYTRTHTPRVLQPDPVRGLGGAQQALFRLDYNEKLFAKNYKDPILLPTTAAVDDKYHFAEQLELFESLGTDLVAMITNDLVARAAEPLFVTHNLALEFPDHADPILRGLSNACVQIPCPLLGGEIAQSKSTHLAAFALGVLEKPRLLDNSLCEPGDSIIALASDGLHNTGFALVREIFDKAPVPLLDFVPDLHNSLAEEILRPTHLYAPAIRRLLAKYKIKRIIKTMAHITTLPESLPRMLPQGLSLRLKRDAWTIPPIFTWLQNHAAIHVEQMTDTFNMGLGFALIVRPTFTKPIMTHLRTLGEKPYFLGKIKKGDTPTIEWT